MLFLFLAMCLSSRNKLFFMPTFPALRYFHKSAHMSSKEDEDGDPTDISVSHRPRVHATLIPGDGVGPELIKSVQTVFKAADVPIEFDTFPLSQLTPLPYITYEQVTKSIKKTGVCLKGTLSREPGETKRTLQHRLRADLDFYGSVVIAKSLKGIECRHSDIDIRIIRESTEGEYSALEHETVAGVVESLKIITRRKSNRIAKFAFDYATKFKRKKVTAIHKANIMKLSDGLFLRSCENVARLYPRIQFEKMIVDNATMQLVSNPGQFDVMVTPNLYGNIINNIVAGIVGGAGLVPGASYSPERVLFEPGAHHTFLDGAGKNIANPVGMLLCGVMLLNHVNLKEKSTLIENAVLKVVADDRVKTKDIGGKSSTTDVTQAVVDCLCTCSK